MLFNPCSGRVFFRPQVARLYLSGRYREHWIGV